LLFGTGKNYKPLKLIVFMSDSQSTKALYNKYGIIYSLFTTFTGYRGSIQHAISHLDLDLPKNADVLDLGCGTGLATEVILEKLPDSNITGFDLSEKMLKAYLKKFPKAKTLIGDFNNNESYSFPERTPVSLENCFDFIISTGSISEYGDLKKAIPFVHSALRKNGLFINFGNNAHSLVNKCAEKIWSFKCHSPDKFADACEDTGFSDVYFSKIQFSAFPANFMKYALIARK
jgi:predicted TPR repeat methyltransferase